MDDEQHQNIGELRPQYQTYDRQKCFIAYSEQAYWSADILGACKQVLSKPEFNLEPDYARKHFVSDVPLRQKALELIANARCGIYDLSCWRVDDKSPWQIPRNVFIELGIAIALNRPTLLLRHTSNKEAGLELPNCLQCLSEQILEFSGKHSLKTVLLEKLPKWVKTSPEQAWWNRYCIFGGRVCEHRETHPRAKQLGQNTLSCNIADGADSSRPDFREIVEDVLGRFSDVTYTYLDALSLKKGYGFLLCTHCQKVRSSPFAIHRITLKTPPEAFIAIGMSIALETQFEYKIPKILITEDVQIVPSLLSGYEVVVAKSDKDKKDKLRQFIPAVIQKVRQTTWKSKPLPFIEILVNQNWNLKLEEKIYSTYISSQSKLEDEQAVPNLEPEINQRLNLDTSTLQQLINLFTPLMSSGSERRGYLIRTVGIESPILSRIKFEGSTHIFVTELIMQLLEYGKLQTGTEALSALLELVRENVGLDNKLIIDNIKSKLEPISPSNQNSYNSGESKISSINQARIRIYELSKELNLDNKELLAICTQLDIAVKSHSSLITETDANRIRVAVESLKANEQAKPTRPNSRQSRLYKASKEGLKKATEAFQLKHWTQEYLAGCVNCTRQTVSNFFAGRYIKRGLFQAICIELNLEWGEIAELDVAE